MRICFHFAMALHSNFRRVSYFHIQDIDVFNIFNKFAVILFFNSDYFVVDIEQYILITYS